MSDPNENNPALSAFQECNKKTTSAVQIGGPDGDKDSTVHPLSYGAGIAVQSISQSVAIAVQDASDYMRDIATIETTAIGMATKKMIEQQNPVYIPLIEACQNVMNEAAKYWLQVGKDGAEVISAYKAVIKE